MAFKSFALKFIFMFAIIFPILFLLRWTANKMGVIPYDDGSISLASSIIAGINGAIIGLIYWLSAKFVQRYRHRNAQSTDDVSH